MYFEASKSINIAGNLEKKERVMEINLDDIVNIFGTHLERSSDAIFITGPMGSGKSSTTHALISSLDFLKVPYFVFKPTFDTRKYSRRNGVMTAGTKSEVEISDELKEQQKILQEQVANLNVNVVPVKTRMEGLSHLAYEVNDTTDALKCLGMLNIYAKPAVAIFLEVQLFDSGIQPVIDQLRRMKHYGVVCEGLDRNFRGEYFPFTDYKATAKDLITQIGYLNTIQKKATCQEEGCTQPATRSQRLLKTETGLVPAPHYDELIVLGDDCYRAVCDNHLVVPDTDKFYLVHNAIKIRSENNGNKLVDLSGIEKVALDFMPEKTFAAIMSALQKEQRIFVENNQIQYNHSYPRLK